MSGLNPAITSEALWESIELIDDVIYRLADNNRGAFDRASSAFATVFEEIERHSKVYRAHETSSAQGSPSGH